MNKGKSFQQALLSIAVSLACILAGLLLGYLVLCIINASGAWEGICDVVKNFMNRSNINSQMKEMEKTLLKSVPLLMCSLSVLFAYKAGLFNIGAAGQYVIGSCAALYCALGLKLPWFVCLVAAVLAGALSGALSGALKAIFNVNEVISCIMLNWISLYGTNMLLGTVKNPTSPYTLGIADVNGSALLPGLKIKEFFTWLGSEKYATMFGSNKYVTIALPISVVIAVLVWFVLAKTKLGFELKATGFNKNAAKYCGMKEKKNVILTMAIAGGLAGMGAALFYLTGFEEWSCSQSSVPAMGFNGIAAAFLGGLHPIGSIFSSYFIQHITDGGSYLSTDLYSPEISNLISSIIIYLCGFVFFVKTMINSGLFRNSERKAKRRAHAAKGGAEQ